MYVYISESSYCYGEDGYGKFAYESYGGDLKAPDARALGLTDMFIPPSAELARLKGSVALPICNGESVCKAARVTFNIDVKCPTSPFGGRSSSMFSYPSTGTTERYRSQGNQCAPEDGQAFPPSALQLTIDGISLAKIPFGISNSFSYNTYSSTQLTSRK
ncbi:hypothetical protein GPECTOR_1g867 [Gonium pectorale]|uniref:Uncharacterized protein n=1 Tax=Gonium pectorale TaxID=33097 RepID=A0A150H4H3_GONPE|nr:hypothetical protein GPECTOR_1g867 [Gonium pectorale]|eukprot:KXZ56961.1 hypothetical protein GPECTOR_1g867 [Gonium pectorale]